MSAFLIVVLIVIIILLSAAVAYAAPWIPTWQKDIERILSLARIEPNKKFYDLGCGDGRLVVAAAKKGAQSVGIELSILPYIFGKIRALKSGEPTKIIFKNFFRADLSDADAVYMFLTPPIMPKIGAKLEAELKPGALAISYHFPIPGWEAIEVNRLKDRPTIYVYQKRINPL